MKLSVAICTWNRADELRQTLESLARANAAGVDWELLVIDNHCTDSTPSVLSEFTGRLPLRVDVEPVPGHSACRNRVLRSANGSYIAWIDDDVRVDSDYLQVWSRVISELSDMDFFGGRIEPVFPEGCPAWIRANWEICQGVFASRDLGAERRELRRDEYPFGANFVLRRKSCEGMAFAEQLGRKAGTVRGFEEIDFMTRMRNRGGRGMWIPESRVEHVIPKSRTSLRYLKHYFFGQGQTWVLRGKGDLERRQVRSKISKLRWKYFLRRLGRSPMWLPLLVELSRLRGQLSLLKEPD